LISLQGAIGIQKSYAHLACKLVLSVPIYFLLAIIPKRTLQYASQDCQALNLPACYASIFWQKHF